MSLRPEVLQRAGQNPIETYKLPLFIGGVNYLSSKARAFSEKIAERAGNFYRDLPDTDTFRRFISPPHIITREALGIFIFATGATLFAMYSFGGDNARAEGSKITPTLTPKPEFNLKGGMPSQGSLPEQLKAISTGKSAAKLPFAVQDIGDSYQTISMYASKDGTHSAAIVKLNDGSYRVGVNQYDSVTNSFSLQDIRRITNATPRAVVQAEDDANKTCWLGDDDTQGKGECSGDGGLNWTGFNYGPGKRMVRGLFAPGGSKVIIELNDFINLGGIYYVGYDRTTKLFNAISGSSAAAHLDTPLHLMAPNIVRNYGRNGHTGLNELTFDLSNNTFSSNLISVGGNYWGSSLQEVLDPAGQLRILETTNDKWTTPPNPQGVTVGAVIDTTIGGAGSNIYELDEAIHRGGPWARSAFLEPAANKIYVQTYSNTFIGNVPIDWSEVEVIPANDPNNFALRSLLTTAGDGWIRQSGTDSVLSYNLKYLKGGIKGFAWIDLADYTTVYNPSTQEYVMTFSYGWTATIDLSNPVSWKKDKFVPVQMGIYLPKVSKD